MIWIVPFFCREFELFGFEEHSFTYSWRPIEVIENVGQHGSIVKDVGVRCIVCNTETPELQECEHCECLVWSKGLEIGWAKTQVDLQFYSLPTQHYPGEKFHLTKLWNAWNQFFPITYKSLITFKAHFLDSLGGKNSMETYKACVWDLKLQF